MFLIFNHWHSVKQVLLFGSYFIICLIIIESELLILLGPKKTFEYLHHIFSAIHLFNLFLAPPAIANIILHITASISASSLGKISIQLSIAIICCWLMSIIVIFANVMINEAIMGVDAGKSFWYHF